MKYLYTVNLPNINKSAKFKKINISWNDAYCETATLPAEQETYTFQAETNDFVEIYTVDIDANHNFSTPSDKLHIHVEPSNLLDKPNKPEVINVQPQQCKSRCGCSKKECYE